VKRALFLILAIAALAALFAVPALCEGPPNPLCFDGPADYTYADDHLWISIQKRVVTEPKLAAYFICDIQTTDPGALKAAVAYNKPKDPRRLTSVIAQEYGAVLAVNGDGYGYHGNGIVVRNSEIRRTKSPAGYHLLTLDDKGDLSVLTKFGKKKAKTLATELIESGVSQIWCFGPELMRDGEAVSLRGFEIISVSTGVRAPRTAIGQIGPLHYVVVVVDGRREGYSKGMSVPELQRVFSEEIKGVQTAFNLDGGGSTTLYFCGEVINRPSGNTERATSDIVYFK